MRIRGNIGRSYCRVRGPAIRQKRIVDRAGEAFGRHEFRRARLYRYRKQICGPGPCPRFLSSSGRHYGKFEQWIFEPKAAEAVFNEYIERAGVEVWYESRILSAAVTDGMIRSIRLENSASPSRRLRREVRAKVYIDCSYEGDLMARAGVGYSVGREDNGRYGETYNGVQLMDNISFPTE